MVVIDEKDSEGYINGSKWFAITMNETISTEMPFEVKLFGLRCTIFCHDRLPKCFFCSEIGHIGNNKNAEIAAERVNLYEKQLSLRLTR